MGVFVPSKYNIRILEEVQNTNNNIIINATAGSGKTTQLIEILKHIPESKDCIFLAFNKSIADELRRRVPKHIYVSTIHSFGCQAMFRMFPGIKIDENKYFKAACWLFQIQWKYETKEKRNSYCYRVTRLVELGCLMMNLDPIKLQEIADEYDIMIFDNEIQHAIQLYDTVYEDVAKMSFTDMVHQPAIRRMKLKKFDYVLVDEVQDLNLAQQAIIKKIVKPITGRLIMVGDPDQSIYGFGGADHDSYEKLKTLLPNTVELGLSISYRCPKEGVKLAKTLVPRIEAHPKAIQGKITYKGKTKDINGDNYVICRNTKPLVEVFRELIKQGKKANIKGREIGTNLVMLINKTKATTIEQLLSKLQQQQFDLKQKLFKKGYARPDEHPSLLKLVEKKEIIKILSEEYQTIPKLIVKIEEIFTDDDKVPGIMLSTIHRVKGLENDRVFFLNRGLIPSKYATTPKELIQEQNLLFIAYTRFKKELIFIDI